MGVGIWGAEEWLGFLIKISCLESVSPARLDGGVSGSFGVKEKSVVARRYKKVLSDRIWGNLKGLLSCGNSIVSQIVPSAGSSRLHNDSFGSVRYTTSSASQSTLPIYFNHFLRLLNDVFVSPTWLAVYRIQCLLNIIFQFFRPLLRMFIPVKCCPASVCYVLE